MKFPEKIKKFGKQFYRFLEEKNEFNIPIF